MKKLIPSVSRAVDLYFSELTGQTQNTKRLSKLKFMKHGVLCITFMSYHGKTLNNPRFLRGYLPQIF